MGSVAEHGRQNVKNSFNITLKQNTKQRNPKIRETQSRNINPTRREDVTMNKNKLTGDIWEDS